MNKNKIYSTNTEFLSVGKFTCDKPGMKHPKRKILSFVLLIGLKGSAHINVGGQEHTLSPDEYLILIGDREHFGFKESNAGVSYYWCHFFVFGEYKIEKDFFGRETLTFGEEGAYKLFTHGKLCNVHKTHLLFCQLMEFSLTEGMLTKSISQNIFNALIGELSIDGQEGTEANEKSVYNILQWIKINATSIKNVKEISSFFGYNAEYLTTMIRKVTGKPLITHLNDYRIDYSKKLLLSTNLSVIEIAYTCGLSDEKYFSRLFKKKNGVSPVQYRKAYNKQHLNNE